MLARAFYTPIKLCLKEQFERHLFAILPILLEILPGSQMDLYKF